MSSILMTTVFYYAVISQGEIWRWSLLGLKGLRIFKKGNFLLLFVVIIIILLLLLFFK